MSPLLFMKSISPGIFALTNSSMSDCIYLQVVWNFNNNLALDGVFGFPFQIGSTARNFADFFQFIDAFRLARFLGLPVPLSLPPPGPPGPSANWPVSVS